MNSYTGNQTTSQTQPCYGCGPGGTQYPPATSQNLNPTFQSVMPTGGTQYSPTPSQNATNPTYHGTSPTGSTQYSSTPSQNATNPTFQGALPTGYPTGPVYGPSPTTPTGPQGAQTGISTQMPSGMNPSDLAPITALNQPMPITTQSLQYINGFLRTQIGKKVTVDFLIGTGTLVDKTGTLLGVGANYIVINEIETDDLLICDFYSIKFVKVYY
jgi:hypothetical protein